MSSSVTNAASGVSLYKKLVSNWCFTGFTKLINLKAHFFIIWTIYNVDKMFMFLKQDERYRNLFFLKTAASCWTTEWCYATHWEIDGIKFANPWLKTLILAFSVRQHCHQQQWTDNSIGKTCIIKSCSCNKLMKITIMTRRTWKSFGKHGQGILLVTHAVRV